VPQALHKTLTNLTDAVRTYFDEDTASFLSATKVTRLINEAKDRVASEVRALKDDYLTITRGSGDGSLTILTDTYAATGMRIVSGSTTTLTLPPDFLEMKLIEITTADYEHVVLVYRDLSHPDMRAAMQITTDVAPSVIYFDITGERTLRWAPRVDTTLDTKMTYVQIFGDLSAGSDELTMPWPLYLAVIHYATASAMLIEGNPNSEAHEARARQVIADVFGANARQTQDIEVATGFGGFA